MNPLRFEWHAPKAADNLRKHGVSMDEARSALRADLKARREAGRR